MMNHPVNDRKAGLHYRPPMEEALCDIIHDTFSNIHTYTHSCITSDSCIM